MFNPWAMSLIALAVVVLAFTRRTPRAWFWVGLGGASFVATSLFWDFSSHEGRQFHPLFTFTCDALVCLALHHWAEEKWELGIFAAFLASVFSSLLRIGGFIPDPIVYASLLELCNLSALLVTGGTGAIQWAAERGYSSLSPLNTRLHSPRSAVH